MLVGLYGGTFDPVHLGHLHAARAAREELDLARVHLILSARPGHRAAPAGDTEHRWQMLKLACAASPGLVADDSEIRRSGFSYTIDTLMDWVENHPRALPCWIMGQDAFATLPIWHRWSELTQWCNIIVLGRPGDERPEPDEVRQLCQQCEVKVMDRSRIGQIYRVHRAMLEVSATDVRERVKNGEQVKHLLADPVYTYIKQHHLYEYSEKAI
ncbi:MAG: nicotinate-nucleotide adenylyltransferase [bacterium]